MGIQIIGSSGNIANVDAYKSGLRTGLASRAAQYSHAGMSGTLGAALAANSSVFAMRMSASAGSTYKAYIERVRIQWTTIVAFTTPITAGRRLALFRGAGAGTSGGTTLVPVKKDTSDAESMFLAASGGANSISTTAALTVTGITFETNPLAVMSLTEVGAAGAYKDVRFDFVANGGGPIILNQGELLAIRNPVVMDAAGTWQVAVNVDWYEGTV